MKPLTKRERRLVALGLLVVSAALVWMVVVQPFAFGFLDRAAQRRDLQAQYARNVRLIASLPALRAEAEAGRRNASRFAVAAPSDALAAEALKERLQRLSTEAGFTVTAMGDLPPGAGLVKVRADLTLTLAQLCQAIRRLESEDTYVVVEYLSVSADRSRIAGRLAPLDVRLELAAGWRPAKGQS
ncbi:MAG: type II secretion system protein M [Caulobacteraceae bacterium]|nr:type II secretion system protein M [Caulobacteraceae bacterium]